MLDYIEKLRKKPERERRRAALVIALVVTIAIALIWGVAMAMRISAMDFSIPQNPADRTMPSLSETLSSFGGEMSKLFGDAAEQASSIASSTMQAAASGSPITTVVTQ